MIKKRDSRITSSRATLIFTAFTAYFFLLLYTLLPLLKATFSLHAAVYWFITGYFLFLPLLIFAIMLTRREGHRGTRQAMTALNLRPLSKRDWKYSIIGLLLVFAFTGVIFGASFLLTKYFGIRSLSTTPWFMEMPPFQGYERVLLLVWLPMFFFNIVGEEALWRGYIQARLSGRYSWLLCSLLWLLFHAPFGIDLMIMLIPIILIIPYAFSRTENALVGVFIHGIYNGPLFLVVSLGLIR
jgi:membrane protease YdiL (CAAX protease family)